jgi:hypothetical protein
MNRGNTKEINALHFSLNRKSNEFNRLPAFMHQSQQQGTTGSRVPNGTRRKKASKLEIKRGE